MLLMALLALTVFGAACTSGDGETDTETPTEAPTSEAEPEIEPSATDPADVASRSEETATEEAPVAGGEGETLASVTEAGTIVCGANTEVPGFGALDENGDFVGFDTDFCRALGAAVLGDPAAVEFRPLNSDQRFPALKSGEVDVLIRNTTWTATRDGSEGATFLTPNFYDGQGMMVNADAGFTALADMADTTICVTSGTTTELNLAARFARESIAYTPSVFPDNETLQEAYIAEQCDGWTSDKSQLAGIRSAWPADAGGPESLVILDETFSKEPLAPVVRDGDSQWAQMVNWTVFALIQAEEFGVTQANVEEMKTSDNPEITRFLVSPVARTTPCSTHRSASPTRSGPPT